jgi:hypothetical protein
VYLSTWYCSRSTLARAAIIRCRVGVQPGVTRDKYIVGVFQCSRVPNLGDRFNVGFLNVLVSKYKYQLLRQFKILKRFFLAIGTNYSIVLLRVVIL